MNRNIDFGPPTVEEGGKSADPSSAEPIPQGKKKDVEPFIELFGEQTVRCVYSKTWNLREHGIKNIEKALGSTTADEEKVARGCGKIMEKTIIDKNAQVYFATLSLLQVLTGNHGYAIFC